MTTDQMQDQANKIADYYDYLKQRTFYVLIDVFKKNRSLLDNADENTILEWRLKALSEVGGLTNQVIKLLSKETGKTTDQIYDLIQQTGLQVARSTNKKLAKALKKPLSDVSQDTIAVINGIADTTFREINNYVNQSLLSTNYQKNGAVRAYQEIIDKTVLEVSTGLKTPNKALKDNIYKWYDNGIKSLLVDKGGHNWSLESYTRMVIDTRTSQVYNAARMESMKEFDTYLATMTSHPAARPACAPIQGKIVNVIPRNDPKYDKDYPSIYDFGYGTPAGTLGINCHHMLYPYLKGVSHNYQTQYDPNEAVENSKIEAKQRYYERNIRALKYKKLLAERLNDKESVKDFNQKIRLKQSQLRDLVKNNKFITRKRDREQIHYNAKSTKNDKK